MKSLLKPLFVRWLRDRALYIPRHRLEEIARRVKVDVELVESLFFEFRDHVLRQVDGRL